jgi:hypothetical protein
MGTTVPGTGGKTVDGLNLGRPALDNSNTLGAKVTFSGGAESAMVTQPLGLSMNVCVQDLTPAPDTDVGAIFDGFAAPSFANHVLTFFADITGDSSSTNGLFYCHQGTAHESILSGDTKPGGGTYNSLEESSTIGWWITHFPDGIVVSTAPSDRQVEKLLWGEVRKALARSVFPYPPSNLTELRLGLGNYAIVDQYVESKPISFWQAMISHRQSVQ